MHQQVQHVANAHHVAVDLLGHPALLLGGGGYLAAEIVDLHHGVGHAVEPAGDLTRGVGCGLAAALGLLHGDHGLGHPLGEARQHAAHLGCAVLGAGRQGAHLVGHHGEATSLLPGPGRFDGGVERQQVGLGGDAAYHPEHAADLLGILLHLQHLGGGEIHFVDQGHHAGGCRSHHLA